MLERFRDAWSKVIAPIAAFFVRHDVSPDVITIVGTLGVVAGALICYPMGWLWQGTLIIVGFVFADMVDGQMARATGRSSKWGAFLDSSLDRFGDAAVFGGITIYFVYGYLAADRSVAFDLPAMWVAITLWATAAGQLTSYVKARAESLGYQVSGGLAARADRLLIILLGALLAGFGVPYVLELAVTALALMSTFTVVQRIFQVRSQAVGQDARGAGA
jgi:CDP-diacylglycerol--glycerol-3-phosphate 3-phosphatidyltransferase